MITQLGRLSPQHLGVIARASVMRYKRSNAPISQIAEALGVDYVLEGSARREKNRIRITAQLIQAHDQTHVWAEEYDRELRDVLALQREVSLEVADRVDVNLKVGLNASTPSTHPIKPDAYEDFLKGQFYLRGWTSRDDALEKAQHYFEHVLSLEPAYASAYAGLANVYFLQSFTGHSPKEVMPKAEDLAGKALQLDRDLAEAHDILAAIKFRYHWDWSGAEQEVKRALELNPSLPAPHSTYADYLGSMGRLEEALRENKIASIQDPLRPEMNFYVGESLMSLKRYDEALMQFRKMLELEPNSALAHVAISKVYAAKGMYNQAITERQNALVVDRDKELAELLGQTFAAAGYDAAKKVLRQKLLARLKQKAERGYVDPMQFALIYARLEDRDQTLLWLEKAYQARSPAMPMLNLLEEFDACRLDPRFQDLMRRVGLP